MVAVVVGRFQVPSLSPGHEALLAKAVEHASRLIVFIGCGQPRGTVHDPLDYFTRKLMILDWHRRAGVRCPLSVLPIMDVPSDAQWVHALDATIMASLKDGETDVAMYGGRDSCGEVYRQLGRYPWYGVTHVNEQSGTELRRAVGPLSSADFRAGVIYASQQKYPTVYPTVDIVIHKKDEILLAQKKDGRAGRWYLIGGFVDPTDHSLEYAANREAREETGLELGPPVYCGSSFIGDWRYRHGPEAIISAVFCCQYIFGHAHARDDISEVEWVKRDDVAARLAPEHAGIWSTAKQYLDQFDFIDALKAQVQIRQEPE